jgi:hypothetical protein
MKYVWIWISLIVVAVLFKISKLPYGIGWRLDQNTHRDVSVGDAIFWVLLLTVVVWVIVSLIQRSRIGSAS